MTKSTVRPVLITRNQIEILQIIREQEKHKSALGITPSIHDVARKIIDLGLKEAKLNNGL